METNDDKLPESEGELKDEGQDFIQDFIEQKRLQNKVLQVILEKISQGELKDKTEPIDKNQKNEK